ncbi:TTL-domain-containing protein [Piromyces finnis]|uniref:TTL-domain-containing protein n=1 Tax=Piromyces finnis TaxID=1754191 RepID=A0A1Y1VH82_9FUNG|nr:TTL-domain-containing protein [Piromyces finnis]|eukprot:ORX56069.1 TTL-domain-containing protein [Piromyces finnis]
MPDAPKARFSIKKFVNKEKLINNNYEIKSLFKDKKKTLKVDYSNCKYEVVKYCTKSFGYQQYKEEDNDDSWTLCWMDTGVSIDRVLSMKPGQKINHFPGMNEICRKDCLARNLGRLAKVYPKEYNFHPKTWVLPQEWNDFVTYAKQKSSKKNTYIAKPDAGCQGKGILLFKKIPKSPKDIFLTVTNAKHHNIINNVVVQTYIASPLLINGMKFDLRVYVLVLSANPLKIYIYKDGLARFATEKYSNPNQSNVKNVKMHLTNYAINKKSKNFDKEIGEGKGSKRYIADVFKEISSMKKYNITVDELWGKVSDVVIKTLVTIQPMLSQSCSTYHNGLKVSTSPCFEILGFDILLDSKLKAWILEVNHSPSFTCDTVLDFEIKRGVIINALRMIDFDNLLMNKLNKKIKCNSNEKGKRHSTFSIKKLSNENEVVDSNELPKIENTDNITQMKKKKDDVKERKNNYSGQYSISTLMDKNKSLVKDLNGIVLYSKLKGPHNLNSYSINNQSKKKKNNKETKTKKRVIDNHISNSLASEVYLGKPLPKIGKNKKNSNSNIKKNVKNNDNDKKEKEYKENRDINNIEIDKIENVNEDRDDYNNNDTKNGETLNNDDTKNSEPINNNDENNENLKKNTDIFKEHDFMYIIKTKKEFTTDEILKFQNIYENENKGNYYRAYPCDNEGQMKKYKSFIQVTSKTLNTNTLATKIRLEYLRKKKEKEEEEERKRILWKKKVKQGYFIGRYKINKKDENNLYEKFKGSLYNKINNIKKINSSDSLSSSTSYTSIANIKNLSFDINNCEYESLDSNITPTKKNTNVISTFSSNQTLNKILGEKPLNNSNNLFKINFPFEITSSSFSNFKDIKSNLSNRNKQLFINGKQINFENNNNDDDNTYFKYVLINEKISKDNDSLRCQSAPSLRKEQSLSGLKTYDIVFENYN